MALRASRFRRHLLRGIAFAGFATLAYTGPAAAQATYRIPAQSLDRLIGQFERHRHEPSIGTAISVHPESREPPEFLGDLTCVEPEPLTGSFWFAADALNVGGSAHSVREVRSLGECCTVTPYVCDPAGECSDSGCRHKETAPALDLACQDDEEDGWQLEDCSDRNKTL